MLFPLCPEVSQETHAYVTLIETCKMDCLQRISKKLELRKVHSEFGSISSLPGTSLRGEVN